MQPYWLFNVFIFSNIKVLDDEYNKQYFIKNVDKVHWKFLENQVYNFQNSYSTAYANGKILW